MQTTTNVAALNCTHLLAHHFVDHSCGHGITRFSIQSYEAKIKMFEGCVLIRSLGYVPSTHGCGKINFLVVVELRSLFLCWMSDEGFA